MKPVSVEAKIRDFILTEIPAARKIQVLEPDDSLFELGLLDSMVVIKTVAFCEDEFGVEIPDQELIPDNFESVRALARLVERAKTTQPR
jgi:acyl carrier protein